MSKESYTVRAMRAADEPAVSAMWESMAGQHARYDAERWDWTDDFCEVHRRHLLETLDEQDVLSLVAEGPAGEVVGYLRASVSEPAPIWRVRRRAQIWDVYVSEAHSRKGVGRMLMERAFDELRARGAEDVILRVSEANRSAVKLYEKVGMRLVTHEMYRRL
jgi:ribosomal protein S18 acetylase RimI-like enzyme